MLFPPEISVISHLTWLSEVDTVGQGDHDSPKEVSSKSSE